MNGQQRYKQLCFFNDCMVKCIYNKINSSYYIVTYKEETIKFCVSDHHTKQRGNMITIISKTKKINDIKRLAFDIYEKIMNKY